MTDYRYRVYLYHELDSSTSENTQYDGDLSSYTYIPREKCFLVHKILYVLPGGYSISGNHDGAILSYPGNPYRKYSVMVEIKKHMTVISIIFSHGNQRHTKRNTALMKKVIDVISNGANCSLYDPQLRVLYTPDKYHALYQDINHLFTYGYKAKHHIPLAFREMHSFSKWKLSTFLVPDSIKYHTNAEERVIHSCHPGTYLEGLLMRAYALSSFFGHRSRKALVIDEGDTRVLRRSHEIAALSAALGTYLTRHFPGAYWHYRESIQKSSIEIPYGEEHITISPYAVISRAVSWSMPPHSLYKHLSAEDIEYINPYLDFHTRPVLFLCNRLYVLFLRVTRYFEEKR